MDILLQEFIRREMHNHLMRQLRDASDPFTIPEDSFIKTFRFSRGSAQNLFLTLEPFLNIGQRITRISAVVQFICALHFYAQGSYQKSVGKDSNCSLSQASVSRCIKRVTNVIVAELSARYIKFPQTMDDITETKRGFFEKFGFPGIIGAIDCTHISITPPRAGGIPPRLVYLNRKNYFSINCQIICDSNLKIININPRYPGSVHDAAIWQMSNINTHLLNNYRRGDRNSWLIGDSGYPLLPFLLTPIIGADLATPEGRYTAAHCRSRNTVERCKGTLKQRLRCLLKYRTLHYTPAVSANIVIACATLHNILLQNRENDLLEITINNEDNGDIDLVEPGAYLHDEGRNTRANIIAQHFA